MCDCGDLTDSEVGVAGESPVVWLEARGSVVSVTAGSVVGVAGDL